MSGIQPGSVSMSLSRRAQFTNPEVLEQFIAGAKKKAQYGHLKLFFLSVLGGLFLGLGALMSSQVGGRWGGTTGQNNLMFGGFGIPFGLMMIVFTGAELVTGNYLMFAILMLHVRVISQIPPTVYRPVRDCLSALLVMYVVVVTVTNPYSPTDLFLFQPQRRSTAATEKNATSSRSHGVGIITIGAEQFDSDSEQDPYGPRPGVLYVIDLAGSERSADSAKHSKERMDETKAVNLSLMSLKECIRARTAAAKPADPNNPNARPHVPYRRSKLTLLMKDVFDIECRRMCSTVVVACVSPSARDAAHSVNTLTYAAPLRVAIAATKDAAPLPVDPKDPVQWSHDRACDWLEEQVKAFPNSKSR